MHIVIYVLVNHPNIETSSYSFIISNSSVNNYESSYAYDLDFNSIYLYKNNFTKSPKGSNNITDINLISNDFNNIMNFECI